MSDIKLRLNLTERQACIVANALRVAERSLHNEAIAQYNYGETCTGDLRTAEANDAADVIRRITDYIMALDNIARG